MAHILKFKKSKGGGNGVFSEWLREAKEYKNEKIDPTKSHLNIYSNFSEPPRIKKKNLQSKKNGGRNSDSVTLAGITVTLPQELSLAPREYQIKILKECNNFLNAKVKGNQTDKSLDLNVSWQIHYDESQPHLHSQFVPIDLKKDKSGKEYYSYTFDTIFSHHFYKTMHQELEKHMKDKFPELEQIPELFVAEEIEEDKYLDENGYNTGNQSHWELKKQTKQLERKLKIKSEEYKTASKLVDEIYQDRTDKILKDEKNIQEQRKEIDEIMNQPKFKIAKNTFKALTLENKIKKMQELHQAELAAKDIEIAEIKKTKDPVEWQKKYEKLDKKHIKLIAKNWDDNYTKDEKIKSLRDKLAIYEPIPSAPEYIRESKPEPVKSFDYDESDYQF